MQLVLHDIEKKILNVLGQTSLVPSNEADIASKTSLSIDQVRRGIEWLRYKKLVSVTDVLFRTFSLGNNGHIAHKNGLPERRLLDFLKSGKQSVANVRSEIGADFGIAIGIARKNGWVDSDGATLSLVNSPKTIVHEDLITRIAQKTSLNLSEIKDYASIESLLRRPGFIIEQRIKSHKILLTVQGRAIKINTKDTRIDVEAEAPTIYPARTHPLKDIIDEIRETFVALGFGEVTGNLSQSGFWNFDALFTPQDHPAREIQDTFYLDSKPYDNVASDSNQRAVSAEHKKYWQPQWSAAESHRAVLRTHTTCVTIRHIAQTNPDSARIFSLGSVFRNEKQSYKHLAEFNQVEGVIVGRNVTLRGLMGIQKEFYKRMGMGKVKFWPTFFPYTEPSLQSMVYNKTLGKWIELFGMGIFRPEVIRPLGIKSRVLAWGGGIERIAMLRYGLSDVRELYANKLSWLRKGTV